MKYTLAAINKIVDDLKRFAMIFRISSLSFFAVYAIYSIICPRGLLAVNIVIALLSSVYLAYYLITYKQKGKEDKRIKKIVKKIFDRSKLVVNAVSLGYMIYSVYYMAENVTVFSLFLVTVSILSWTLQLLLQAASQFIDTRKILIVTGLIADAEGVPLLGGYIRGKEDKGEIAKEFTSQKNREILERQAAKDKQRKDEQREEKQAEKEVKKRTFRLLRSKAKKEPEREEEPSTK